MKEVVVMLSIICAGHMAARSLPDLVDLLTMWDDNQGALTNNPRFTGFDCDKPISLNDIQRYNRLYGIVQSQSAVTSIAYQHRQPVWQRRQISGHSHPSSLISATSNPSERSASPAIF